MSNDSPTKLKTSSLYGEMGKLVMYIVIPKTLKMGIGKVGATCGHAAQLLMQEYRRRFDRREGSDYDDCQTILAWLDSDYGKIVLGANDAEFGEVRKLPNIVTVVDIGLKQVAPGSVTAVGLWPTFKSAAPDIIKGLEPLR
jgi:peptidyl-tRNA hydrolase